MPPKPIAPHPGHGHGHGHAPSSSNGPDVVRHASTASSASPTQPPSSANRHDSPSASSTKSNNASLPPPIRTSSGTIIQPKPLASRGPGTVADAVAASLGSKRERKRKRIHYSCAECHRRKHKCDRQTPCQPCIDRGLGDSCRPFEDGDQFGDMRDRVQRLEDIVEGLAVAQAELAKELSEARRNGFEYIEIDSSGDEQHENIDPQNSQHALSKPKPRKKRRLIRPDTARGMEREELYNSEAHAIAAVKGEIVDSSSNQRSSGVRYDEGGNPLEGGLARDGDSWFGALALPSVSRGVIETEINGERLELGANFPRFPASVKLHRLIHEGGAPENILQELMACLPSKADTDRLLDIYFRDINHTRLPIHEGTFRQSYEELMEFRWGNAKEERGDDGARHVPFLAFLFAILATAMRSLPESMGSEAEAKKGAMRLYHACRRTINIASTIRVDHIDLVLAHLFAARFLICQRQSAESWSLLGNAIRAAQAIGLHRDGSKLGLDAITTERRRRLWALIFYMDKTTSILLGRPQAIQEFHCDTLPPSDIDIDTMPRAARPYVPRTKPRPHTPPGVFLFVAIRHELARLTGKIVEHFQNLASPRRYADVVALDEELEKFRREIPDIYRMDRGEDGSCTGTDKAFDDVCPWLPLHRYLLNIEYHYVRIALHRPYVLRNSEKYSHSRAAAFESAKTDKMVRHTYRLDVKWEPDRARKVHMGGLYRLFNATMMIGIALLLEPNGPDAPQFMKYLEEFIELHRHREGDTDQCSKREVKIIELFRAKAKDPTWCATSATGAKRNSTANGAGDGGEGPTAAAPGAASGNATQKLDGQANGAKSSSGAPAAARPGQGNSSSQATAGPQGQGVTNAPPNGTGTSAFQLAQLFGVHSQSPAGGSNHSGDGVTPPPFAGLFNNGGISGMGNNAMGMSMGLGALNGVSVSGNGPSDASAGDLAQSIFDQLGGYEPSFGMLNPTPTDGLSLGAGTGFESGLRTGGGGGTDAVNGGLDLSSWWSSPAASSAAATAPSINIPTTSAMPQQQQQQQVHAPNTGSGPPQASGDWGLLPWGGLIEAIAQSSHGTEAGVKEEDAVRRTSSSGGGGGGGGGGGPKVESPADGKR